MERENGHSAAAVYRAVILDASAILVSASADPVERAIAQCLHDNATEALLALEQRQDAAGSH